MLNLCKCGQGQKVKGQKQKGRVVLVVVVVVGLLSCLWCSSWTEALFPGRTVNDLEKYPDFGVSCPEPLPPGCPVCLCISSS